MQNVIVHPMYNPNRTDGLPLGGFYGDIALLVLRNPSYNRKIALAPISSTPDYYTAIGWGINEEQTGPDDLQEGKLVPVSRAQCREAYKPVLGDILEEDHICAGNEKLV